MAIFDEISVQMKDALKARAEIRLRTLRSVRAAFLTEMKRDGAEHLSDDVCTALLRRLEKQRRESIEAFEQADRPEQAEAERAELGVIQEFRWLSSDDLRALDEDSYPRSLAALLDHMAASGPRPGKWSSGTASVPTRDVPR